MPLSRNIPLLMIAVLLISSFFGCHATPDTSRDMRVVPILRGFSGEDSSLIPGVFVLNSTQDREQLQSVALSHMNVDFATESLVVLSLTEPRSIADAVITDVRLMGDTLHVEASAHRFPMASSRPHYAAAVVPKVTPVNTSSTLKYQDGLNDFIDPTFGAPPASAAANLPDRLLVRAENLKHIGDVADHLERALDKAGYGRWSYYRAANGFALATQLEQITDDGKPLDPPDRWIVSPAPAREFSLSEILSRLFRANKGRFRVIVFVVTDTPFGQEKPEVTRAEALEWTTEGANRLPPALRTSAITDQHHCTVLIYEFLQRTGDHPPEFIQTSSILAKSHLSSSKILSWE